MQDKPKGHMVHIPERDVKYAEGILTGKQQMYVLIVTEIFTQTMQPAM